ncbi:MAG: histidine phosphatase family protein [Synergistaceae bacterium]|nr:histidine phosphatase family protein [Synergistaceae bacterium]
MKLFLMRHGDAEKQMTFRGDRPLSPAGEREADAGGLFLRISGEKPDVIMHSSKLRSRMTAERVMAAVRFGALMLRADLEEDSSPEDFLASVTDEFAETGSRVLAVGHNPFMSRLGSLILAGPEYHAATVEFKTGALLGTEILVPGNYWRLRFFLAPKALAGIYEACSKPH